MNTEFDERWVLQRKRVTRALETESRSGRLMACRHRIETEKELITKGKEVCIKKQQNQQRSVHMTQAGETKTISKKMSR